jgi:hypothetical protein
LTKDECTLFANPGSLNSSVREYLHSNGVSIQDYDKIWSSLETWGRRVKEERASYKNDQVGREMLGEQGEKLVMTDKVLIGAKASWAVAVALGEVSSLGMARYEVD